MEMEIFQYKDEIIKVKREEKECVLTMNDKYIQESMRKYFYNHRDEYHIEMKNPEEPLSLELWYDDDYRETSSSSHPYLKYILGFGTFYVYFNDTKSLNSRWEIQFYTEGEPQGTNHDVKKFTILKIKFEDTPENQKHLETLNTEIHEMIRPRRNKDKMNIYIPDNYGDWSLYSSIQKRSIDTIYFDPEKKRRILEDCHRFIRSEKEYELFGIPYKRTYLLTGKPGTGKTSLIKALCNEIHYHLAILTINKDFDNLKFLKCLGSLEKKTALLIEDIDAVFNQRESVATPLLTFSNVINALDGVLTKQGLIVFITTNHPEKMDPALMRSGRMDMIIEMETPKKKEYFRMFQDLLKDRIPEEEMNSQFDKFYSELPPGLTTSSILNYLFFNRESYLENIDKLKETEAFMKKASGETKGLYT
jgi:DNA replication protein DnaC